MRLAVRPLVVSLEDRSTPATFFVDPTLSPTNSTFNAGQPNSQTVLVGTTGFASLNEAINAAELSPGADTIVLSNSGHLLDNSAGTVVITGSNPLTITAGSGSGFTAAAVVQPTDDTNDDLTAVLQSDGGVLNLSNITLDGDGNNLDVGRYVLYTGATGSVSGVIFQTVAFITPPNNNPGIPLTLQAGSNVRITGSTFTNYGNAGVSVADSTAIIQSNQFIGGGFFADPIQYGVQVANINSDTANVVINANTFTNYVGFEDPSSSAAVFLFTQSTTSPTAQVFGNSFSGNQLGVLVDAEVASGLDSSNVVVFGNDFTGGVGPAIAASQSTAGSVQGANNNFAGAAPIIDGPNGISDNVDIGGAFLTAPPPTGVVADTAAGFTLQTGIAANGIVVTPRSPLAAGNIGQSYSQTISATGGTGTTGFTFAVTSGALPQGLTLNPNGTISGIPSGPVATSNFVVTATSNLGDTAAVAFSITIGPIVPVALSPTTLPNGRVLQPYNQTIAATGGIAPFTFAVTDGSLPQGLTLNSNGTITGTPVLGNATSTFTVTATDAQGNTGVQVYTIAVLSNQAPLPNQYAVGQDVGGGTVNVYNAAGAQIATTQPFGAGYTAGVRTAVADVTGDGIPDLIVASGPGVPVSIQVIDGNGGAVIATLNPFELGFLGGAFVAAGDITGDGIAEIIVTPDQSGGPRVVVFRLSAANQFTQFASFLGITDDVNFRGGVRAAVADINGDGIGDIIVAAGFGGGPRVAVFNGTTVGTGSQPAKLFNDFFAFAPDLRDGTFVAGGDVNADGYADIIVAAGPGGGPRVQVLSGLAALTANGVDLGTNGSNLVLANFFAGDPNNRQGARVAAKNLDQDLFADIVTGDGQSVGGRTNTYLGQSLMSGVLNPNTTFDAFPGFSGGVFVG